MKVGAKTILSCRNDEKKQIHSLGENHENLTEMGLEMLIQLWYLEVSVKRHSRHREFRGQAGSSKGSDVLILLWTVTRLSGNTIMTIKEFLPYGVHSMVMIWE